MPNYSVDELAKVLESEGHVRQTIAGGFEVAIEKTESGYTYEVVAPGQSHSSRGFASSIEELRWGVTAGVTKMRSEIRERDSES